MSVSPYTKRLLECNYDPFVWSYRNEEEEANEAAAAKIKVSFENNGCGYLKSGQCHKQSTAFIVELLEIKVRFRVILWSQQSAVWILLF